MMTVLKGKVMMSSSGVVIIDWGPKGRVGTGQVAEEPFAGAPDVWLGGWSVNSGRTVGSSRSRMSPAGLSVNLVTQKHLERDAGLVPARAESDNNIT